MKILFVNLTSGNFKQTELPNEQVRKYLGGSGLACKILWDMTGAGTDPLAADNPLIFMTGLLTGTLAPSNSHYTVASLSPLTGIWGEAHSGGYWAYELKHAGFGGIVFQGKSEKPVYLWIHNGEVEIRDASRAWGKGIFDTNGIIHEETEKDASIAAIGPAGENLVKFACIINEGRAGRAAARCGLGAVMGSKRLKAVVVKGTQAIRIFDEQGLKNSVTEYYRRMPRLTDKEEIETFRIWRLRHWERGHGNIRNFSGGDFPGFSSKLADTMISGEKYYCRTCTTSNHECHMLNGRRRQVLESMIPLGSQCLIDDMSTLQEAFDLCQDFGMDSISAGGVMSFAIEIFEKGLISEADTGGIKLGWGNAKAMLEMLKKVAYRDGLGRVLGEGVKRAAEYIGGTAPEYAIHVKGLEVPAHDPRCSYALSLEYATANRGADHLSAQSLVSRYTSAQLGLSEEYDLIDKRFRVEEKAPIIAKKQNYMCLFDSLGLCKLLMAQSTTNPEESASQSIVARAIQPSDLVEWINLTIGWDIDTKELLRIGERIFTLMRLFNVRKGISRKDDMLPPRLLTSPVGRKCEAADNLPFLGELLNRYYSYRDWNEEGIPSRDKLKELAL